MEDGGGEGIRVDVETDDPGNGGRYGWLLHWTGCVSEQVDGDGPGDYMHSGIRGGPHVGAFRRCSFTETELKLHAHLRATPVVPLPV